MFHKGLAQSKIEINLQHMLRNFVIFIKGGEMEIKLALSFLTPTPETRSKWRKASKILRGKVWGQIKCGGKQNKKDIQGLKSFTSHLFFLRKLPEQVLQQNEGLDQQRGRKWIQHRKTDVGSPGSWRRAVQINSYAESPMCFSSRLKGRRGTQGGKPEEMTLMDYLLCLRISKTVLIH